MAGIGVNLNKIFSKHSIAVNIIGFGYSALMTVAPMFFVILAIIYMNTVLGASQLGYYERELFSCTVLYIFIFSMLTTSPFNAVLSRYLSDVIYEETYDDILPCFHVGLLMNTVFSCCLGIPFCVWEYFHGQVDLLYVFTGFCGYMALVFALYGMLYLSICKDYGKISLFFFLGMLWTVVLSYVLVQLGGDVTYSMLLSIATGFLLIAGLEIALVKQYFKQNSGRYLRVLGYFREYWMLVVANAFYSVGLFVHNFVFWTTDLNMTVADSFVCCQPYDMASCLAMFTNISATMIFISRVEMHFHGRYKAGSEAVIGGRGCDIQNTRKRMMSSLIQEVRNLVNIQFIISIIVFLIFIVVLPQYGFSGLVMDIYPSLATGYFIVFVMYSVIIFLYYFNDLPGTVLTAGIFFLSTLVSSIIATRFAEQWYGIGVCIGAFLGWTVGYLRLQYIEKHMDTHIFCEGDILERGKGKMPSPISFNRYNDTEESDSSNSGHETSAEVAGQRITALLAKE